MRWIVAGDVDAVLHGPNDAAHLFGPQKGATPSQVEDLDRELARLADLCGPLGLTAAATPGAGAAGGLGFAALLLGAEIRSGAEFFLELLGFDNQLAEADAVVTGEGRIDDQTLHGKLPFVVAQHAAPRPTFAIVGRNQITPGSPLELAFTRIHQISDLTAADTRRRPRPHRADPHPARPGHRHPAEHRADTHPHPPRSVMTATVSELVTGAPLNRRRRRLVGV